MKPREALKGARAAPAKRIACAPFIHALLSCVILSAGGCCSDDPVEPARVSPATDYLPEIRLSWSPASAPAHGRDPAYVAATGDDRDFTAALRTPVLRWFLPPDRVQAWYLQPGLPVAERDKAVNCLELYLRTADSLLPAAKAWEPESWGGIMLGMGYEGIDLRGDWSLELWINDFAVESTARRGVLHFDFGFISEDFFWPLADEGELILGTFESEDANRDGIFTPQEDTGLDGVANGPEGPDHYSVDYNAAGDPFPYINGTEANNREDTENIDGDHLFETTDGYYTLSVDLTGPATVDVLRDFAGPEVEELRNMGLAWRLYRLDLAAGAVIVPPGGRYPDLRHVTHVRIWFEDAAPGAPFGRRLQLARLNFVDDRR
jgi:hypothetical protein